MDDIREIERQTQLALQKKMGDGADDDEEDGKNEFLIKLEEARNWNWFL